MRRFKKQSGSVRTCGKQKDTSFYTWALPSDDGMATRKDGVGIALDEKATSAWRAACRRDLRAVNSRIVTTIG